MYLKMISKNEIRNISVECGSMKNNSVLVEIPDDLLIQLSSSFIQKLKLVFKNMNYISIKEIKRFDKSSFSSIFDYKNIIHLPYNEDILYIKYEHSYNLVREWENDIKIIEEYDINK